MRKSVLSAVALAALALAPRAFAEEAIAPQGWQWEGIFGAYDQASLKRGFQVYNEVCSNCHSLKLVAYRNLLAIGMTEAEAKAVAASKQVADGPNDNGDMFKRPGKLSDHFVPPFPNDQAARAANNGALPPDLSLMTKARKGGPDYVYAILTGFAEPPANMKMNPGMNYNKAFEAGNHQIAMPPPLSDGSVTFADKTPNTLKQEARDIVSFLNWAAEPELPARKALGLKVLLFTLVLTAMMYALKRKIWADVH